MAALGAPLASGFPPSGSEWVLLVVALVMLIGPRVAERLRLPGLIGLLIGGMIVGPNVLGWAQREGSVEGIGNIGLLLLMFMAGLELDLDDFRRNRSTAARFGLLTFAIPLVAGTVVGLAGAGYGVAAAVLFGSLWASHTLVAYPIVRERGLANDPAVATAVGGTVITDTLALFVLAVVVGAEQGGSTGTLLAKLLGGLAVLLLVSFLVVPRLVRWFFAGAGQHPTLRFVAMLASFSGCAVLAHVFGLEGIVGAFFAGLALNRLVPNRSGLMERLEFFGNALLIPFFLVSTGMLIDPAQFRDLGTIALALASIAVVVLGKAAAAWIAGRLAGYSRPQTGLVFSLSVAQAAATLAAVIIGFEAGIFSEQLVNAALVVVLLSIMIATLGTQRAVERVPPADAAAGRLASAVLVPVTDETWDRRVALGARIAAAGAGVVMPLVVSDRAAGPRELEEARERLGRATEVATAEAAEVEPVLRHAESTEAGVLQAALDSRASVILAGLPGAMRARDLLFGGPREDLVAAAATPIVVVAPGEREPRRAVLALGRADLAPGRRADLRAAVELARLLGRGGETLVLTPARDGATDALADLEGAVVEEYAGPRLDALARHATGSDAVIIPVRLSWSALAGDVPGLLGLPARPTVLVVAAGHPAGARNGLLT